MKRSGILAAILSVFLAAAGCWSVVSATEPRSEFSGPTGLSGFRGPVDVVLDKDQKHLLTVNQLSNSVSLVSVETKQVIDELHVSSFPTSLTWIDNDSIAVTCQRSGRLEIIDVSAKQLKPVASIFVGYQPTGIAVDAKRKIAFVALSANAQVAKVDLQNHKAIGSIDVGPWPRYLTLSPDATRLAVGCSGDGKVYVIDPIKSEVLYDEPLSGGINLGHMQASQDGKYAYFPWMVYRTNPINVRNIQLGWVLASRIARVRLDGSSIREAISLDVPRLAVADPHGLAITPNEHRLVVTASGTHELLVYRLQDLPFEGVGGPGDLIDRRLTNDNDLFYRIELGGRPMGLALAKDNRTAFVANYLTDSIQVIDIESRELSEPISLGKMPERTREHVGMEIFYDGRRSLDQWYSCHTCHYNGGTNSRAMDTENDGSINTFKTVLPLEQLQRTGPWTWHGWQNDTRDAMQRSFVKTMQGKPISEEDSQAILAYFNSIQPPPSPFLTSEGTLTEAAIRGKAIFQSDKAGCARCHSGPYFTDGEIHDVGLGSEKDVYKGYNTPSLVGLYRKVRFLHDGRTRSLEQLLTQYHAPENVSGSGALSDQERADLIEYLKSL